MALNQQDMMLTMQRLSPLKGIDPSGASMQREQLKLMREKFENEKQQQREQLELNKLEEQGRMAREKMVQDRILAEQRATQAAAVKQKQNEAMAKFTELAGGGDIQGAHAMVPLLTQLGVPVSLEGEENGLPRYRLGPDPEEEARAAGAIGYPTDDTGTLAEPAGIGSSSDMTAEQIARVTGGGTEQRAATDAALAEDPLAVESSMAPPDAASPGSATPPEYTDATDEDRQGVLRERVLARGRAATPEGPPPPPAADDSSPIKPEFRRAAEALDPLAGMRPSSLSPKPAAEPDYTGGVPKNVIDMGAMHQQTLASLDPALKSIVQSYPEEWRESAGATAEAVKSLPLGAVKGVEAMKSLRSSPDSLIQAGLAADAQRGENAVKAEAEGGKEAQRRYDRGFRTMGKEAASKFTIGDLSMRRTSRAQAVSVLTNKSPEDDYLAGAQISRLMGEKGATTEPDVQRALGSASVSFLERIKQGLYRKAIGGLKPSQKKALLGVLSKAQEEDESRAREFMGNIDGIADDPETDKDVARGLRDYVKIVIPADLRKSYREGKQKAQATPAASTPTETKPFNMEEDSRAEAGGSGDFDTELRKQAAAAGLNYDAIKHVVASPAESGGNPAAVNERSGATGILQFMPSIAEGLGTTTAELKKMTAAEQVPFVIKYFKDRGMTAQHNADDYYVVTAAGASKDGKPVFVGKPDDTVVYPKGTKAWKDNVAWRPSDGGDITVGSIKAYSRRNAQGSTAEGDPEVDALMREHRGKT